MKTEIHTTEEAIRYINDAFNEIEEQGQQPPAPASHSDDTYTVPFDTNGNRASIYIAGPMAGYPNFNVAEFERAELIAKAHGWEVVNPFDLDEEYGIEPGTDEETFSVSPQARAAYMRRDLPILLLKCDAILMLDGWKQSKGASIENIVARAAGLRVFGLHPAGTLVPLRDYHVPLTPLTDHIYEVEGMERVEAPEIHIPVEPIPEQGDGHEEACSILDEAHELVYGDRNEDYGHPYDDFSRTAQMWSALKGVEIGPEDVALMMVALKLSREVNRPKRDNRVDGVGYLLTYERVLARREGRE